MRSKNVETEEGRERNDFQSVRHIRKNSKDLTCRTYQVGEL